MPHATPATVSSGPDPEQDRPGPKGGRRGSRAKGAPRLVSRPRARELGAATFRDFYGLASPWLGWILGDEAARARFVAGRLDPERLLVARRGKAGIVAFIGFRVDGRGPLEPTRRDLAALHGPIGGALRRVVLALVRPRVRADELYIESFKTRIGHRRRGYGEALLAAVEAEARRRGKRRIRLHVDRGNERARRFYLARGFRIVGAGHVPLLGRLFNHTAVHTMVKELGP